MKLLKLKKYKECVPDNNLPLDVYVDYLKRHARYCGCDIKASNYGNDYVKVDLYIKSGAAFYHSYEGHLKRENGMITLHGKLGYPKLYRLFVILFLGAFMAFGIHIIFIGLFMEGSEYLLVPDVYQGIILCIGPYFMVKLIANFWTGIADIKNAVEKTNSLYFKVPFD